MDQIEIYSGEEIISRVLMAPDIDELESLLEAYGSVFTVMDRAVAMPVH